MSTNLKRKPRDKPAAHDRPVKQRKSAGETPRTSGTRSYMGEFSAFEGGDKTIADEVRHEIAVANGESIDNLLDLYRRIEAGCGDPQFSLNLSIQLRIFRGTLRREELMTARQTSLNENFLV
ncbi:hypothetical protein K503DRAFT_770733 [Rhizopogon vinicolor AM-OR11-026]|uniref:Uncharacterized protein n=1 Tax=Rhizopogon vinicolor AM-OR11-026 TaxID=1314800 RepID=A0A1B7N018_9AGAM|nr:hypothetical protein K503DRAFT_770733 [Rhizopogon vinicolor AM-OR11-026]